MKIRLETRDGEFVHEATVPPFQLMPEVMMWGIRFFALCNQFGTANGQQPIYREVCCFAIVEEVKY